MTTAAAAAEKAAWTRVKTAQPARAVPAARVALAGSAARAGSPAAAAVSAESVELRAKLEQRARLASAALREAVEALDRAAGQPEPAGLAVRAERQAAVEQPAAAP